MVLLSFKCSCQLANAMPSWLVPCQPVVWDHGLFTGNWKGSWRVKSVAVQRLRGEPANLSDASKSWLVRYSRKVLPVCQGSALRKWAPSSWKRPCRSPALLSPCLLSPSVVDIDSPFQGSCAISGLGWSLFRALRKPNVSGKLQLEVKSYLYCPYFFTHNICSTFRNIPSCERLCENNV